MWSFGDLTKLSAHKQDKENKVFYEYLMTWDKMFQIVKHKQKENAVKESKEKKERGLCWIYSC